MKINIIIFVIEKLCFVEMKKSIFDLPYSIENFPESYTKVFFIPVYPGQMGSYLCRVVLLNDHRLKFSIIVPIGIDFFGRNAIPDERQIDIVRSAFRTDPEKQIVFI